MKRRACAVCLAISLVVALACLTQAAEKVRELEVVTTTGVVQSVDPQTRMVTVTGPQGKLLTVKAGESVQNISQFKPGDAVTVRYYESMALQISKPGGQPAGAGEGKAAGIMPSGSVPIQQATISGTIEAVDTSRSELTVKGPQGKFVTVKVPNPQDLANLKIGDQINIAYSEATAISLEKAKA